MNRHMRHAVVAGMLTGLAVPGGASADQVVGVGRLDGPPTRAELRALRAVGLRAQGFKKLPFAIVAGTDGEIAKAQRRGALGRFFADQAVKPAWTGSNRAMGVDALHVDGFTGKGIRVAVVDTGLDATHPDLADHVVHNVKIVGPEYAKQPRGDFQPLVVAADEGPYSNTDLSSGHGTLVSGVIAADGTTSKTQVGVAPDAELIGYGVGDVITQVSILTAFDHILSHPEWGIDVVNGSIATVAWLAYDPAHPMAVATKRLADAGIPIAVSEGNAGYNETQMTANPYAVAPWVIGVASTSIEGARSAFSSNGLAFDNSQPRALAGGHVRFDGDRIGLYHPTVAAPGENIESSCATASDAFTTADALSLEHNPCVPGQAGSASGTSLSAPQVTGLLALLKQARPEVTPMQLRDALAATAVPTRAGEPFWQVGYGSVDAQAAMRLVRSKQFKGRLKAAKGAADERVLADRDFAVDRSDHWAWIAPLAASPVTPDARDLAIAVPAGTDALSVTIAYPATNNAGANSGEYTVTVSDGAGSVVGTTTPAATFGASTAFVDLRGKPVQFGSFRVHVEGTVVAGDDPLSLYEAEAGYERQVSLAIAQLDKVQNTYRKPRFAADGTLPFTFAGDPERAVPLASPEGCEIEPTTAQGTLAAGEFSGGPCHSAGFGVYNHAQVEPTGLARVGFESEPLSSPITIGGTARLAVHVRDAVGPAVSPDAISFLLHSVGPDGIPLLIDTGIAIATVDDGRNKARSKSSRRAFPRVAGSC